MVARALNRHATSWGSGPVDTALHRIAINDVSIILLRYGAPVKIEPTRPGTYYIVQIPLGGRAQVRCGSTQLEVDPVVCDETGEPLDDPPQLDERRAAHRNGAPGTGAPVPGKKCLLNPSGSSPGRPGRATARRGRRRAT